MKKKDEIEDIEIDDEIVDDVVDDEIVDDDVIDDVDDVAEVQDEDDDDEVEVPSGKGLKSNQKKSKKKLGAGAITGITLGSIVAVVLIAILVLQFGLGIKLFGGSKNVEVSAAQAYTGALGTKAPTATAHTAINSKMTAGEMCLAVVDNYYNADYVAQVCNNGGVKTKVGPIDVPQAVQSFKVRIGKGDAEDSTNSIGSKYYVNSKSFGIANMYEEYYSTGNNATYKKAEKVVKYEIPEEEVNYQVLGGDSAYIAAAKGWKAKVEYSSMADFISATSTDFTKIWSYKINQDTISNYDDTVKYDKESGCYYFTIKPDKDTAVADYVEVMKYQLGSNMGFTVVELEFTQLELEFCVYENGFIKYMLVNESYKMNVTGVPAIGSLDMVITNNCMNEFSFDSSEEVKYYINASKQDHEPVVFNFDERVKAF